MTGDDYKKLFDDNGELPKELRSAIDKYHTRVHDEMAERSSKVVNLAEHLFNIKAKKNQGLNKSQVDEIVRMINDVDNEGKHVDALKFNAPAQKATDRWRDDKLRTMVAEADDSMRESADQLKQKRITKLSGSEFDTYHQ